MAAPTGLPSYLAGRSQKLVESTDVVLIVSGREFPVHSTALAVGCKFFDDLFFDSTVEVADQAPRRVVLVPEGTADPAISPEGFQLFLEQLYKGPSVEPWTEAEVELLLPVADFFGVDCFLKKCGSVLADCSRLQKELRLPPQPGVYQTTGPVNRDSLMRELRRACRYSLRALMAQCLPYAVEDLYICKDSTVLAVPLDATVLKAVVQATASCFHAGHNLHANSFKGSQLPALKADFYLEYLTAAGWGK